MPELSLPPSVERRNKLDISLGYCADIDPTRLLALQPAVEVRVDDPPQLIDFLLNDTEANRLYFVRQLRALGMEWEYVAFARRRSWIIFCSVFSTSLAYHPLFGDGKRRRLCCGGTRIIAKASLEKADHTVYKTREEELVAALEMDLRLSQAMTGKNLSNGFNIGGSKSLVYVDGADSAADALIGDGDVREFSRFMARFHNSITQALPLLIGTGSDLNFHEHGLRYYDLCSRISPSYFGNEMSARRWRRTTTGGTTEPTAAGVMACIDAVARYLELPPSERSILIKGLGGIGRILAERYAGEGWQVYATELREHNIDLVRDAGIPVKLVDEEMWDSLSGVSIFSPNASSSSINLRNLPVLRKIGVRAVVGGENNVRDRDTDADLVYSDYGILTFADFLLNGGGAWIVDAEMIERPVENVRDWIEKYQVPTVLTTIELARETGRSPESLFAEFIDAKVKELVA